MEEEIFTLILQARNEATAIMGEVNASLRMMGAELEQQTRIAEASYGQMTQASSNMASAHTRHAEESLGAMGRLKEGLLDIGKTALSFAAGNLLAQGAMGIQERFEEAITGVQRLGTQTLQLQRVIGGSAEDVSGMIALFERWGISAEAAQTRLAFFARGLAGQQAQPGQSVQGAAAPMKVLDQLGVAGTDAQGQARPTLEVLKDLADHLQGLSAVARTADLRALFGRGGEQLAPLFAKGSEGIAEFIAEASKLGVVINQDTVDQTLALANAHHVLEQAMEGITKQIGVMLLPGLVAGAVAFEHLAMGINQNVLPALRVIPAAIGGLLSLMDRFRLATAAVGAVLAVMLAPSLYAAATAFAASAVAAAAAGIAMVAPFLPVIAILAGVAAAGVLLQKGWESNFLGIRTAMQPAIDWLVAHLPQIVGVLFILLNAFFPIPLAMVYVAKVLIDNWANIQNAVSRAVGFIGDRINDLRATIEGPLQAIGNVFAQVWAGTQNAVNQAITFIGDKISGLMDFLAEHNLLGVTANWREGWAKMAADATAGAGAVVNAATDAATQAGNGVIGIASQAASAASGAVGGVAGAISGAFGGSGTPAEHPEPGEAKATTNTFGLTNKELDELGAGGLAGMTDLARIKEATASAQDDLKEAESEMAGMKAAQAAAQLAFDQSQLSNQQTLLELKREGLAIDQAMLVPQQQMRDLQMELKAAAQDQVRLQDEQRLLALEAADFGKNSDLKRIQNQITQAQDILQNTRSIDEAGQENATIKALQQQAFNIRRSMFGSQNERTEAEIAQSGDQLGVKINQNAINQQIAAVDRTLEPLTRQKNAIDDATKAVQMQADIAKTAYDQQALALQPAILAQQAMTAAIQDTIRQNEIAYNQQVAQFVTTTAADANITPKDVRGILKKVGLSDSAADQAATTTAELERLQDLRAEAANPTGAHVSNVEVNHTYNLDVNVEHLNGDPNEIADVFKAGLHEAAAGSPTLPQGVLGPY